MLILRGSSKKNPGRYSERVREPVDARALGSPPQHLTTAEREAWRYIAACAPAGVLRRRDRLIVEEASCLLVSVRARGWGNCKSAQVARLEMALARMGMSPSDVPHVSVPPEATPNE